MIRIIALAVILAAFPAFAGKAKHPKVPPPPICDAFGWCKIGAVAGFAGGNYTPWVVTGPNAVIVMGNGNGAGNWTQQRGTLTSLGASSVALPYTAIYDEGPATYRVRTSAIQRADDKCYGMLTVGNGYPSTDSFRPAFATSDDCVSWVYRGRMLIDGSFAGYGQTDTAAFVVREGSPPLDHVNAGSNKFLTYVNYQDPTGAGTTKGLILVYSSDGVSWFRYADAFGAWIDVLPAGIITAYTMPNGSFPTAALTPYGIHIMIADTYPATKLAHIVSCDGVNFTTVETNSSVRNGSQKGTGLAYDPATKTIHALTAGVHFQMTERDYGC